MIEIYFHDSNKECRVKHIYDPFRTEGSEPGSSLKTVFPGMDISIIKIRRSWDHLIFVMGISILVKRHIYIETGPWRATRILFHWPMYCMVHRIFRCSTKKSEYDWNCGFSVQNLPHTWDIYAKYSKTCTEYHWWCFDYEITFFGERGYGWSSVRTECLRVN